MLPRRGAIRHATCALTGSATHCVCARRWRVRSLRRGFGTRMPRPPPTTRPDGPTAKQLQLLRRLANASGQTFTWPASKAQASAEIRRLAATVSATPVEQLLERRTEPERLRDTLPPQDAAAVAADEVTGYGAHARWRHRHQDRGGRS